MVVNDVSRELDNDRDRASALNIDVKDKSIFEVTIRYDLSKIQDCKPTAREEYSLPSTVRAISAI
jgi:hypothetical protein